MPGISRNGQDTAGGVAIEGSSNVSVNSKGVKFSSMNKHKKRSFKFYNSQGK